MSYFEYRDYEIEDMCNSIRERILESKKPLPPKVMNHYVSIRYRIGEGSYQYPHHGVFSWDVRPEFKTRQEAEDYLNKISWLKKEGDNFWVEDTETSYYDCKDGSSVKYHYEIHEFDIEEYEDGNSHVEYSDSEKDMLSEALYHIEKARIYMQVYNHCSDQWSFGNGRFSDEVNEEMEKFEKEFTEELPEDYDIDGITID